MAERGGFEPSPPAPPRLDATGVCESGEAPSSPIASSNAGQLCAELAKVVAVWGKLSAELRAAILAIIASAEREPRP